MNVLGPFFSNQKSSRLAAEPILVVWAAITAAVRKLNLWVRLSLLILEKLSIHVQELRDSKPNTIVRLCTAALMC